jgi:hypothetical protein
VNRKCLFYIIFFCLFLIHIVFSAYANAAQNDIFLKKAEPGSYDDLRQVGVFKVRKNAEKLVKKLRTEGEKAYISETVTKENKKIYKVLVRKTEIPSRVNAPAGETQKIASYRIFTQKRDAELYAGELRNKGFSTVIKKDTARGKKVIYTVFSEKTSEVKEGVVPSGEMKKDMPVANVPAEIKPPVKEKQTAVTEEAMKDVLPAREVKKDITVAKASAEIEPVLKERTHGEIKDTMKGVAAPGAIKKDAAVTKASSESKPVIREIPPEAAQGKAKVVALSGEVKHEPSQEQFPKEKAEGSTGTLSSQEVYGTEGGYIHPFVTFRSYFTDNVFNTRDEKKSDYVFVISPGIWLTVPRIQQKLLRIDSSTIAPGGYIISRLNPSSFRRYQTYLFYGADIEQFAKYSSENTVTHKLEGLLQYNLKGGLTFELVDKFLVSHDIRGTGLSDELDTFKSNLAGVIVVYDTRKKMQFRVDYSSFLVDYDANRNNFRDRHDNAFSGYAFYKISPKTSSFLQYEYIDIIYNDNTFSNSIEQHFWGGIDWDITAKSTGRVKAGYGFKDFDRSSTDDSRDLIFEAQIDHKFTPKTSVILKAFRKTQETNISETDYVITTGAGIDYLQRIRAKLLLSARLGYWTEIYRGDLTYAGESKQRKDNIFEAGLALRYDLKEWLKLDIGYLYSNRDSNFSDFDYANNSLFLGLSGEFSLIP